MNLVFVGAGRLATQLAKAIHRKGHVVQAVYSRTMDSAQTLCSVVGGFPTDSIAALPLSADAYILAVKDSVLSSLIPCRCLATCAIMVLSTPCRPSRRSATWTSRTYLYL